MSYVAKIMMDDVPLPRLISRSPSTSSTHRPSQVSHPPGRNEHRPWPRHRQTDKTLLFLIICACLFSITSASSVYIEESMVEVQTHSDAQVIQAELDRLAQTGRILVDPNPPSDPNAWILATEHDDLQRRGLDHLYLPHQQHHEQERRAAHSSSSSSSTTMITTTKPTSTATATSSGVSVATDTSSFTLPAPFDQGFGNNVTESCSNFLLSFLTNQTFQSCLPFSLLLQGSTSFFTASKSITKITQTLDATCAADPTTCTPLMTSLATNLTLAANCGSDYTNQNPLVQNAFLGLRAYAPLYTASCLRNPSTSSYCFADAVTNASSPTDSYPYYLPLNISLPGGSRPTCNACLQDTMGVFVGNTTDRTGVLAGDYVGAATLINLQCGPGFVNQSLAPAMVSGGMRSVSGSGLGMGGVALVVLLGSWLL